MDTLYSELINLIRRGSDAGRSDYGVVMRYLILKVAGYPSEKVFAQRGKLHPSTVSRTFREKIKNVSNRLNRLKSNAVSDHIYAELAELKRGFTQPGITTYPEACDLVELFLKNPNTSMSLPNKALLLKRLEALFLPASDIQPP